jgi:hypothetical protein
MSCSDEYFDHYFSYQICPVQVNKCGSIEIEAPEKSGPIRRIVKDQFYEFKEIRGLDKGETCSYRVRAKCGAPVFDVMPAKEWSSITRNFNITWNEFEARTVKPTDPSGHLPPTS